MGARQRTGTRLTPEVKDAWIAVYTTLADTMKGAAPPASLRPSVPLETNGEQFARVVVDPRLPKADTEMAGDRFVGLARSHRCRLLAEPRTQSVRQFARNLIASHDLPGVFWDERLSTAAVTRKMIAADLTRNRRGEIVDRVAIA